MSSARSRHPGLVTPRYGHTDRAIRWVDDPETGERVRKEVPVRSRTWFWKDEQGNYMLEVRYGNRRLELKPKKSTIEVGEANNLMPTLETEPCRDCRRLFCLSHATMASSLIWA